MSQTVECNPQVMDAPDITYICIVPIETLYSTHQQQSASNSLGSGRLVDSALALEKFLVPGIL